MLVLASSALSACGGEQLTEGLEQPLRVTGAQFFEGPVPGLPAGQGQPPLVTSLTLNNRATYAGERAKRIEGRASTDAASIAIGFAELGSGYWLRPVGAPDVTSDNELSWSMTSDFSPFIQPGLHTVLFAAADAQGNFGTQTELALCVLPPVPDNLNTCDATRLPPHTVVSLSWS